MTAVRVFLLAFLLALAGCTTIPIEARYEPPPFDVPAPPPTDLEPVEFIEPPRGVKQVEIRGRVVDIQGRPIPGALLWVEGSDLREPVNNMQAYLDRRAETLVRTSEDGVYRFVLNEGFFFLTASAPGYHLHRFQPSLDKPISQYDVTMRKDDVMLVGHRGAHYYAPENTRASFEKAHWLGIDVVEADIRITRDGKLVVMHDRDLLRTTGHHGVVHETHSSVISRLDAGRWFGEDFRGYPVPMLDELFQWAQEFDMGLVLDVKGMIENETVAVSTWRGVLDAIEAWHFEDRAVFATFSERATSLCAARGTIQCAFMTNDESRRRTIVQDGAKMGADILMLRRTIPDELLMAQAKDAGISIHAWALNAPPEWQRMQELGVLRWGTDRPGFILDHLNANWPR